MIERQLPPSQFANVIRWALSAKPDRVKAMRLHVEKELARLHYRTRSKWAIKEVPAGSDQFDTGSLMTWMANVTKADTEACYQIVTIQATLAARLGG